MSKPEFLLDPSTHRVPPEIKPVTLREYAPTIILLLVAALVGGFGVGFAVGVSIGIHG